MTKKLAAPSPMPAPSERVSLREASRLLNVSRVYVTQLAETGQLSPEVGFEDGDRLYARPAVLEYRAKMKKRQAAGLKKMIEASERAGLYEDEANLLEFAASRTETAQEPVDQHLLVESRVGRSGKATVPASVLRLLKAKSGSELAWSALPNGAVSVRAKKRTSDQLGGILTRKGRLLVSAKDTKP